LNFTGTAGNSSAPNATSESKSASQEFDFEEIKSK
jgi:hypothetical protein